MAKRTINAAYYEWRDENGTYRTDRRGTVIEIPEGYYLERGDKLGMFEEKPASVNTEPVHTEPPVVDTASVVSEPVADTPVTTESAKVLSFDEVVEQNGPEVVEYVKAHPETAEGVLAAEMIGKNRSTVVAELTKLIEG